MRDCIGWSHIKDYKVDPHLKWTGVVDEERLKNFVPANLGDSAHEAILRDCAERLPELTERMQKLGAPGVFLELEPHLKGGGQFGGFSGPDGMGVAVRALCSVLDYVGIDYQLRTMDDIRHGAGILDFAILTADRTARHIAAYYPIPTTTTHCAMKSARDIGVMLVCPQCRVEVCAPGGCLCLSIGRMPAVVPDRRRHPQVSDRRCHVS